MTRLARRELLSGVAAAGAALARPYVAHAADNRTLTIWWNQGYYAAEDQAFSKIAHAWEERSGVKINVSIMPSGPLDQKVVSALATGDVPDLIYSEEAARQTMPQAAWDGLLIDVSDVVATQQQEYSKTSLEACRFYNRIAKQRSFYGVPLKGATLNIAAWETLVEEAGYRLSDIPKTWDSFFEFFDPVQERLRKLGMRHTYGLGYTLSATGSDTNNLFAQFLVAYGGSGLVSPDGGLHLDDPVVRKAIIVALTRLTTPYKKGYVPPSSVNWNNADNNNAFHSKEVVMTPNETISISAAVEGNEKIYYHEIATLKLPLDNDSKPVPVLLEVQPAYIPKGAKNIDSAKDFLRYLIQPTHLDAYLKEARGRWLPVMESTVRKDPYWLDPRDPHRLIAIEQGVLGPTTVKPYVYNPGYAQVNAEEVWGSAEANVINGMKPEEALVKASERISKAFAKYQIS